MKAYIDLDRNVTYSNYGIMFHHFHDDDYPQGQGSISADQFEQLLLAVGLQNILSPEEWKSRLEMDSLEENHTVLTFDDMLLCQYKIALPVLKKYNLKAFWFVYTSVMSGEIEMIETYRKLRTVCFEDINAFYQAFFTVLEKSNYRKIVNIEIQNFDPKTYLSAYKIYSYEDRRYRYIRDEILSPSELEEVMNLLIQEKGINLKEFTSDLWMSENHIKELNELGHEVGLHSHSHQNQLLQLDEESQKREYSINLKIVESITKKRPDSLSHPLGLYNAITLKVLRNLGIKYGFRDNLAKMQGTLLEIPREDHSNLIRKFGL